MVCVASLFFPSLLFRLLLHNCDQWKASLRTDISMAFVLGGRQGGTLTDAATLEIDDEEGLPSNTFFFFFFFFSGRHKRESCPDCSSTRRGPAAQSPRPR